MENPPPAPWLPYCIAWSAGIVMLTAVLRWDPWQVRYQLPLFALAAPLFATALPKWWLSTRTAHALHFALVLVAQPPLFFNQSRELLPLTPGRSFPVAQARPSYLEQTANARLFANDPGLRRPYENAVDALLRARVTQIGLMLQGRDRWEYPIWRMLRDGKPDYPLRIRHLAVQGKTEASLEGFVPEAVFWLGRDKAPDSVVVGERIFRRAGSPEVVAAFFPADQDWAHFGITAATIWPQPVPEVLEQVAWRSEGVHDDGWLEASGSFAIRAPRAGALALKGMVPGGIGIDHQQLEIRTQSGERMRRQLEAGPFEINIPIQAGRTELTFSFSGSAILPRGDGRAVGALLQSSRLYPK